VGSSTSASSGGTARACSSLANASVVVHLASIAEPGQPSSESASAASRIHPPSEPRVALGPRLLPFGRGAIGVAPGAQALEGGTRGKHVRVGISAADELQADGQPVPHTGRDRGGACDPRVPRPSRRPVRQPATFGAPPLGIPVPPPAWTRRGTFASPGLRRAGLTHAAASRMRTRLRRRTRETCICETPTCRAMASCVSSSWKRSRTISASGGLKARSSETSSTRSSARA
jgi:hypothetical protein